MSEPRKDPNNESNNPNMGAMAPDGHTRRDANPWKTALLTVAVTGPLLIGAVLTFAALNEDESASPQGSRTAATAADQSAAHRNTPPPEAIEDCNRYAAAATRDKAAVARDTLIGSAIGAGLGAATGAIADGGKGAGKGAGIGAVVGATAGTAYGFKQEQDRTAGARAAYRQCMARRGYN